MKDTPQEPLIDVATQEAIKANPFVVRSLNLVKLFLLASHADWTRVGKDTGLPAIESEEARLLYNAICLIMGDNGLPEGIEDCEVYYGSGQRMRAGLVLELGAAIAAVAGEQE